MVLNLFMVIVFFREHTVADLVKLVPNLGLVIDLTNTNKYYNGQVGYRSDGEIKELHPSG